MLHSTAAQQAFTPIATDTYATYWVDHTLMGLFSSYWNGLYKLSHRQQSQVARDFKEIKMGFRH